MKKIFYLFIAVLLINNLFAQNNILLEIDDEKITTKEFLHIYKKNNTGDDAMTLEAMNEYMDLFINFKLKVHEAKKMRLDTSEKFINELRGYISQLAQPYLTDKEVEEKMIKETYNRMLYDVNVSHILIRVDGMALPEDTVKAYNKIKTVYKKLQEGDDFEEVAKEFSEDESVKFNDGNLGYRTALGMVYSFETQMYNTPVGEFSKPFRTNFGYHVLKVNDKRPAKGRYNVAHIMMLTPEGSGQTLNKQAEEKIYEIKEKIEAGEDFAELAKEHSQDRRSAENGGVIGWVNVGGRMIPEFENAIFEINEIGQMSEPLKTNFGWHLIKVIDIEPVKPFEEIRNEIISKISNTERAAKSKKSLLAKLKDEYDVNIYKNNLKAFYKLVTDSIFHGTWTIDDNTELSEVLLSFKDRKYTQKDFYEYINRFNRRQKPLPIKPFVDNNFENFIDKMIIAYEETILEEKYPDFKYLINEYHDGILLFELTDMKVWSKAISDTAGLRKFYNANKNNYMWDYRYETKIFECKDERTSKRLYRALNKDWSMDRIESSLNKKDSSAVVLTMHDVFEKGINPEVDEIIKDNNIPEEAGFNKVIELKNNRIAQISVIKPQNKSIDEARGIITADYQNFLEKEWIKELRNKYNVKLHDEVLKKIVR